MRDTSFPALNSENDIPSISLTEGLNYWCNVEDEPQVLNAKVEERIVLIENAMQLEQELLSTSHIATMEVVSPSVTDIGIDNMLNALTSWA